jgi:signal transduction histidine kinase
MACATDTSRLKWSMMWQARLAQDARNAKAQQEAFIDVVSHEMRNPPSAIVHCADSISLIVDDIMAKEDTPTIPDSILEAVTGSASAASTILDCCNHWKRIIDDILTLSRLESTFLSMKPTAVRPMEMVRSIIAMFEAELRLKGITTRTVANPRLRS